MVEENTGVVFRTNTKNRQELNTSHFDGTALYNREKHILVIQVRMPATEAHQKRDEAIKVP